MPTQLSANQQAKLTLFPEYFNAPANMFAEDKKGHVRYKRRGSVAFNLQQTKGSADVDPLGWQHTAFLIDTTHKADRPNGDYQVRSTPLGGASVTTLKNLAVYDATMFFAAQLFFLLDVQPQWEQLLKTVLADAKVVQTAAGGLPYIAIPAATLPAISLISQALEIFDGLTGGSDSNMQRLIEHLDGTPTELVLGPSSESVSRPGAVKVPLGTQTWVLLPESLADQFLSDSNGHAFKYNGSLLRSEIGDATMDAAVARYPYVIVTTQVVGAATVPVSAAPSVPAPSPAAAPAPSPTH